MELEHLCGCCRSAWTWGWGALFNHAVRRAASLGAEVLGIEADPNAQGFYRRMGARRLGEIVYNLDGQERVLPLLAVEIRSSRTA